MVLQIKYLNLKQFLSYSLPNRRQINYSLLKLFLHVLLYSFPDNGLPIFFSDQKSNFGRPKITKIFSKIQL